MLSRTPDEAPPEIITNKEELELKDTLLSEVDVIILLYSH